MPNNSSHCPRNDGAGRFSAFNPASGDVLIKGNAATLATLGNFVKATISAAGDTTLSFDATGTGLPGIPFAVLKGVTFRIERS